MERRKPKLIFAGTMEEVLPSFDELVRKKNVISSHRAAQKRDAARRDQLRKKLVKEIVDAHKTIASHRSAPSNFSEGHFGCLMEDLRELKEALFELHIADEMADRHWKHHFSLPQMKLSHNERKFLSSFSTKTAVPEVPRRTPSPVDRARESHRRSQSQSHNSQLGSPSRLDRSRTMSRGDGSLLIYAKPRKERSYPISAIFRLPENGSLQPMQLDRPTAVKKAVDERSCPGAMSIDRAEDTIKLLNADALVLMQRNALRDAKQKLDSALETILSVRGISDPLSLNMLEGLTKSNLSTYFRRCRSFARAEKALIDSIELEKSAFDFPSLSNLINYAALKLQLNDVTGAERAARELESEVDRRVSSGERISRHLKSMCDEQIDACDRAYANLHNDVTGSLITVTPETTIFVQSALPFDRFLDDVNDLLARIARTKAIHSKKLVDCHASERSGNETIRQCNTSASQDALLLSSNNFTRKDGDRLGARVSFEDSRFSLLVSSIKLLLPEGVVYEDNFSELRLQVIGSGDQSHHEYDAALHRRDDSTPATDIMLDVEPTENQVLQLAALQFGSQWKLLANANLVAEAVMNEVESTCERINSFVITEPFSHLLNSVEVVLCTL